MGETVAKYLATRADLENRPLEHGRLEDIVQVAVIPIRMEKSCLSHTLESLAQCPEADCSRTLVIGVVNNPPPGHSNETAREENRDSLGLLRALIGGRGGERFGGLRIGLIDASSKGCELPENEGVGLARKLGLDWGLHLLHEAGASDGALISLDADTRVAPNYLAAIRRHFAAGDAWGAIVPYAHPIEGTNREQAAILCYELFLRYHILGLAYARSPYAFPSVGSTLVCSPEAYAAVSGMNRRQGGEDFYFAQKLAKTGAMDVLHGTTVYPSPRPSDRVPFGTGPRVRRFLEENQEEYRLYHPASYRILKEWLEAVEDSAESPGSALLAVARGVAPALCAFLESQHFERTWARLQENARDRGTLVAQIHRWFDGFKTLKLIHYLRDHGFPLQPMFESIAILMTDRGLDYPPVHDSAMEADLEGQKRLLETLRRQARGESP